MTKSEREQREGALELSNSICPVCKGSIYQYGTPQFAHKLANTETNRKKYGTFFMNSRLIGVYTCSLGCNHLVQINNNPREILKLLADIVMDEIRQFENEN